MCGLTVCPRIVYIVARNPFLKCLFQSKIPPFKSENKAYKLIFSVINTKTLPQSSNPWIVIYRSNKSDSGVNLMVDLRSALGSISHFDWFQVKSHSHLFRDDSQSRSSLPAFRPPCGLSTHDSGRFPHLWAAFPNTFAAFIIQVLSALCPLVIHLTNFGSSPWALRSINSLYENAL